MVGFKPLLHNMYYYNQFIVIIAEYELYKKCIKYIQLKQTTQRKGLQVIVGFFPENRSIAARSQTQNTDKKI